MMNGLIKQRKVFLFFLIMAIIFSIFSLIERSGIENNNNKVELVMDNRALNELKEEIETDSDVISLFAKTGLTGVAVYEDCIGDLINNNSLRLFTGNEIIRINNLSGYINPFFTNFNFDEDSAFIIIKNKLIKKRFESKLLHWSHHYQLDYLDNNSLVIFFPEWKTKYLNLSLGFDPEMLSKIKENDLKIIPRFSNHGRDSIIEQESLQGTTFDTIVFAGDEVSGYPDNIDKTAAIMKNNKVKFGMIEPFIARQKGADRLAKLLNFDLLRVHSIQQKEMDKYSLAKIVDRYIRAVRERNVRFLYLKPFLEKKENGDLLASNINYLSRLKNELKVQGYSPGQASPFAFFSNSFLFLLFISAGIISGGIILLDYILYKGLHKWQDILLLVLALAGVIYFYMILDQKILTRQLLALGCSAIFPSLAVITQFINGKENENWLFKLIKTAGISLAGGLFLAATLAHISFIVKVNQFRGVKFAFIIPLLVVSYYYFRTNWLNNKDNIYKSLFKLMNIEIKLKHVLLFLILIIGGIFYIGRTGNYPLLPVPAWELKIRNLLERFLYVRPRFKAFLIGHPFLLIGLVFKDKIKSHFIFYPLLIMVTIGQVTVLNTFSHIHTPVTVSVIRVFNGYWLGLLLGFTLMWIIKYVLGSVPSFVVGGNDE